MARVEEEIFSLLLSWEYKKEFSKTLRDPRYFFLLFSYKKKKKNILFFFSLENRRRNFSNFRRPPPPPKKRRRKYIFLLIWKKKKNLFSSFSVGIRKRKKLSSSSLVRLVEEYFWNRKCKSWCLFLDKSGKQAELSWRRVQIVWSEIFCVCWTVVRVQLN